MGGIFEVSIDGKVVYTNEVTYRFPTDEEIFAQIDALR
jgi:Rdx family protein